MTPTQQALEKIERIVESDPQTPDMSDAQKEAVTQLLDSYYNSRGTGNKFFTANMILEIVGLKFSQYGAAIAETIV